MLLVIIVEFSSTFSLVERVVYAPWHVTFLADGKPYECHIFLQGTEKLRQSLDFLHILAYSVLQECVHFSQGFDEVLSPFGSCPQGQNLTLELFVF